MASSAVSVSQSIEAPIYRGASEGTGMAAAELARATLNEEGVLMEPCECCGLVEECTRSYVARVRKHFCGRYICGLCTEAVKEERRRNKTSNMEAAVKAHMVVCAQFNRSVRNVPVVQLANIAELMRQILRKSTEGGGSAPNSPNRPASLRSQGWHSSAASQGMMRSSSCTSLLQKPLVEIS